MAVGPIDDATIRAALSSVAREVAAPSPTPNGSVLMRSGRPIATDELARAGEPRTAAVTASGVLTGPTLPAPTDAALVRTEPYRPTRLPEGSHGYYAAWSHRRYDAAGQP